MDGGSISIQNFESNKDSTDSSSDLIINLDYPLPFQIDGTTSIEYEVKNSIKQCISLLKNYLFRVLIITLVLCSVLYFQGILMFLSDTYYMSTNRVPLLDRVHQVLDKFDHPFTPALCNSLMFIFVFTGIFRVVFFTPLYYFLQMALRYVALFGTAYFLRGFFVYMTTVPSCYYNCNPDLQKKSFFPFMIRIFAGYMGLVTNCTDLIISGHTMFTVVTCLLFAENVKYLATKIILGAFTSFVLFLIIACKYHYTIDVLFGIILSLLLHYFYMTKLDAYGVQIVNKIYHSKSLEYQQLNKTLIFNSFLAKFLVKMELLEERLLLGQKLRTLYLLINNKPELVDEKLFRKFNHFAHLFGADESDDLLTLYRGTRNFNFYYWKYLYCKLFKRKQNVVVI